MQRTEFGPNKSDCYVYQVNVASLAGGANTTSTINIRADANFVLHKLAMYADIAAAVQTDSSRVLPAVTLQITDTGPGRQLFSDVVPLPSIFGAGGLPFILPGPRLFAANSTISFAFTNISAATTYRIYLSLIGVQIYIR